MFAFCDIDYIIDCDERIKAINYFIEFQSDNFNLLNTYIVKPLSIQEKLNKKVYDTFFNKKNIDTYIDFYKIIASTNNYPLLTEIFFFNFSKILCFYITLYKGDVRFEEYQKKLIEIINNNKLEGINSNLINFVQNLLLIEDISNNDKKKKLLDKKKKSIINKYKKKVDSQYQVILKKYSSSDIEVEPDEAILSQKEEICVYCRQSLNNDINNYFGKICYLISDYFIDILKKKMKI
jgi:hypothetical protein